MLKLIISHETRQVVRTTALWSILALLVGAILFAAWAGGRSIERQIEGAQAAEAFEDEEIQQPAERGAICHDTSGANHGALVRVCPEEHAVRK